MSPTYAFPQHTLASDTHMYPTHTCFQHKLAPDTHMYPNTLAPDTHMYPRHNFQKKIKKISKKKINVFSKYQKSKKKENFVFNL